MKNYSVKKANLSLRVIALVLASCFFSPSGHAQDQSIEGDYVTLESYGLYRKPTEGGLGRDLWDHSRRSVILENIAAFPDKTESPFLQKSFFGTLLSVTNTKLIENDIKIEPGKDLFTIRLEKLLQMGAYKQAADMYALSEKEPYHPALAVAGITAYFASGNKSLGCLEAKTSAQRFADSQDIHIASAFCDLDADNDSRKKAITKLKNSDYPVFKALAKNKNYKKSYTAAWPDISLFELAALRADNRLKIDAIDESLEPRYVMMFLNPEKADNKDQFILAQQAARWGFLQTPDLKQIYKDIVLNEESGEWATQARLLQKLESSEQKEGKWAVLKEAFASVQGRNQIYKLLPFADYIETVTPDNASMTDLYWVLSILNLEERDIGEQWLKALQALDVKPDDKDFASYAALVSALYIASPQYKRDKGYSDMIKPLLELEESDIAKSKPILLLQALIHNSAEKQPSGKKQNRIYDKTFLLTLAQDYVMPTYQVWDRLRRAAGDGRIGETILLSSTILHSVGYDGFSPENMEKLYPGMLREIVESFDKVGLTQLSRQLAIGSALGLYDKKL